MQINNRTVQEAHLWASSFLAEKNLEEPIGELLLRHYLQVDRTHFLMMLQEPLATKWWEQLQKDLERHASGIPIQYLIGYESFYGRRFHVNRHVLIPRPETEELVMTVSEWAKEIVGNQEVDVVDVGTGSGAIAVTLALENPNMNVTAIDISRDALKVAEANADSLRANVEFIHGDLLTPFIAEKRKVDIIVSNPPYIPLRDKADLAVHVKEHEPHLALFGGEDGLDLYRRFIIELPKVIKKRGIIAFEVGDGQAQAVCSMLSTTFPQANTKVKTDINKKERIVLAYGAMTTEKM
ncbi:peptide chain release factor N(5)-glutamine methyltransferase [Bacillus sp. JCM 19034]|uniref:peptide chain release factor N(5)-glutamine methyltransferase n=1 Tax=Bacillus sp. JCM 19034 TaxID=1481928 RepID=UPI000784D3FD|nr:peptide chain release factor N(5)-glutamine methyltransferase [Bacillus sp. JCM 19034]